MGVRAKDVPLRMGLHTGTKMESSDSRASLKVKEILGEEESDGGQRVPRARTIKDDIMMLG